MNQIYTFRHVPLFLWESIYSECCNKHSRWQQGWGKEKRPGNSASSHFPDNYYNCLSLKRFKSSRTKRTLPQAEFLLGKRNEVTEGRDYREESAQNKSTRFISFPGTRLISQHLKKGRIFVYNMQYYAYTSALEVLLGHGFVDASTYLRNFSNKIPFERHFCHTFLGRGNRTSYVKDVLELLRKIWQNLDLHINLQAFKKACFTNGSAIDYLFL